MHLQTTRTTATPCPRSSPASTLQSWPLPLACCFSTGFQFTFWPLQPQPAQPLLYPLGAGRFIAKMRAICS